MSQFILTTDRPLSGKAEALLQPEHGLKARKRFPGRDNSYPLGRPAQAGAIASIEDEHHFQQTRMAMIQNRDLLTSALTRLGFDVLPSSANFLFARRSGYSGEALASALRERAVLVRHFSGPEFQIFSAS